MDIVIYHADCCDGFGAAWSAWKRWPDAEFLPYAYGRPAPDLWDKDILIVDFSFSREDLLRMKENNKSVQVLDHHASAQRDLEGLDFAHFDMNKSGAMLAWEYCHPKDAAPTLIEYVQDRDLWHKTLPHCEELFLVIDSWERTFKGWDKLDNAFNWSQSVLIKQGEACMRFFNKLLDEALRRKVDREVAGFIVPAINVSPSLVSEGCHRLLDEFPDAPFVAAYSDNKYGTSWSLRSRDDRMDVSVIAKSLGGGGHRNAAGFGR